MKRFEDIGTNRARGLQIWQILIGKAHNRQILTYGGLAKLMGIRGAGVLSAMLGHVMYVCIQEGLPPLTILVVNQTTGVPGAGLLDGDFHALREQVLNYEWFKIYPPTEAELHHAYQTQGQG